MGVQCKKHENCHKRGKSPQRVEGKFFSVLQRTGLYDARSDWPLNFLGFGFLTLNFKLLQ